ncbi:MAG: anaerobic ribonucleoside-triphosphate reductase activating protein [Candidatus Bathyarchaeia archaeon]
MKRRLPIIGLQRLSLVDYPGRLCTTIFTAGCNFRCPYCFNVEIVLEPNKLENIPEEEVLNLLKERRGFIDGVCIGGGEPTIHGALPTFIRRVKLLGLEVKLDTNGSRPRMLRRLMEDELLDYVAMDVKAPLNRYQEVVGAKLDAEAVKESIRILRRGRVDHEFRTTVVPGILAEEDILEIARTLAGSKRYVIQQFRPGKTLSPKLRGVEPYPEDLLMELRDKVAPYFSECKLRL